MNKQDLATSYHQFDAFGATGVGQIVALYDRILRDLQRAQEAIGSAEIEERVNCTNHALVVIGELQSVLDFERGGEPARRLSSFYKIARALATEASIRSSREKYAEVIGMFARLRAAWSKAEKTVPDSGARPRSTVMPPSPYGPGAPPAMESSERPRAGGWKA